MRAILVCLFLTLVSVSTLSLAASSASLVDTSGSAGSAPSKSEKVQKGTNLKPFSRMALGVGVSLMGVNLQAATDIDRYLNLRTTGNIFSYSVNNISTNGFSANGTLNLATFGASLDLYPFYTHGFRLSPGLLFYNQNSLSASATAAAGTKFTLNSVDYYSSAAAPVQGTGTIGFNARKPAFTLTTGWGNMISRTGAHWSFPFELGAAFVGAPTVNLAISGEGCNAQGQNCVDVATDPGVQSNLQAQITKFKNDLNPLTVYPILSFGVTYNFPIR